MLRATIVAATFILLCTLARAENWAQWRGPNFNGSTSETDLPGSFSIDDPEKNTTRKNVAWICDLPGASNATPVVFDGRVFVSSNNADGSALLALCIDRKTGSVLWRKTVVQSKPGQVSSTGHNTLASPSPVTDGKQVLFTYGTGDLACFDMDGKPLWSRNIPKDHGYLTFMHGYSSTPLLYKDKLYIQMLRRDKLDKGQVSSDKSFDSYLLCLDWKTGGDIFKSLRISDAVDGEKEAYSSPVPYERAGRPEILIAGALWLSGHNPEDGREYWHWGTLTPWKTGNVRSVWLPVATHDCIVIGGPRVRPVFGIKAGGEGDLSKTGELWEFKDHDCSVASPLLYDNYVYLQDPEKKKLTCMEPASGKIKWTGSLDDPADHAGFSSSPAGADGKLYCMNERGNVVIVSSQEFKVLCRVMLDEGFTASSPVVAQGHVFFRTAKRLYCIGK